MELLNTLFYFIVTLGILVFIHELGHFLAAKLFGMRVDTFSLGFPPRAFGKKIGETDYCISWIPIGGFVKIAGMVDESFDTGYLENEPQPWEFRSKPIWQRMVVISAGVIMNVILAIAIFWGINYVQGKTVWDTTEVGSVMEASPAAIAGIQSGDKILTINDKPMKTWDDIRNHVYIENIGNDLHFLVDRRSNRVAVDVPEAAMKGMNDATFGIAPAHTEIVIETVDRGKPAEKVGLKHGDVLVGLDMENRVLRRRRNTDQKASPIDHQRNCREARFVQRAAARSCSSASSASIVCGFFFSGAAAFGSAFFGSAVVSVAGAAGFAAGFVGAAKCFAPGFADLIATPWSSPNCTTFAGAASTGLGASGSNAAAGAGRKSAGCADAAGATDCTRIEPPMTSTTAMTAAAIQPARDGRS